MKTKKHVYVILMRKMFLLLRRGKTSTNLSGRRGPLEKSKCFLKGFRPIPSEYPFTG